jgi:DNA-binding XRE family transcriptional regulator
MESTMATVMAEPSQGRSRVQDVDRHVGARMRARRIMLGLTQQQLADLIEVTYQQAHKYEKGINRLGRRRAKRSVLPPSPQSPSTPAPGLRPAAAAAPSLRLADMRRCRAGAGPSPPA